MKPCVSKKFLVARWPGSASASMPMQPRSAQKATSVVDHRLAHADLPRLGLDEQVGDHAEARAGAQGSTTTAP